MLAGLAELVKVSRESAPATPEKPIGEVFVSKPIKQPIDAEEREKRRQEELRSIEWRKTQAWRELVSLRGERYRDCRLKNFACETEAQVATVEKLREYCTEMPYRIQRGESIVLFGPRGTGKDHLLMALAHAAIGLGKSVEWKNGMDLFGDVRDAMTTGTEEKRIVSELVRPDVLYLSDPLPVIAGGAANGKTPGCLTDFQASMLFRILDGRYSRSKPTWVTVNVASGKELDERIGPQNADRLRDGALGIFCNWPSYRKAKQA